MKIMSATLDGIKPLVSIVLTTYNSEVIIEKVLRAILNQNFSLEKVELIIVDGGSRDRTLELIERFLRENSHRFYDVKLIIHDRNYGVTKARNDGIKASKGHYILILDHDIVMDNDTLRLLFEFLSSAPQGVGGVMPLLYTVNGTIFDRWREKVMEGKITVVNTIADCVLIKREVVEKAGLYDEHLGPPHTICEEREYGARVASRGLSVIALGWVKAYHYTGIEDDNEKVRENQGYSNFKKLLAYVKFFGDSKYRYALKRWINSMPLLDKLKWYLYACTVLTFPLVMTASLLIPNSIPLYIWLILLSFDYLTVLKEYFNSRALAISILYSAIALSWRLARSVLLLIPA